MPSPEYEQLLSALPDGFADPSDSVEQVREKFAQVGGAGADADVEVEPASLGGVEAYWVTTPESDRTRHLLHVHGGAFVSGSARDYLSLAAQVARTLRARVAVFGYRLAPEQRFPAALDDCVAACRGALEQGVPPGRLGISGDSCGGGLAVATLLRLRDAGDPLPACGLGICGWFDLEASGESAQQPRGRDPFLNAEWIRRRGRDYLGPDGDPRHPYASPLYADLAGLPPLFLQCGGVDLTGDDSVRLAERARAAGVEVTLDRWPEMIHAFQILPGAIPEAVEARRRLAEWTARHIP